MADLDPLGEAREDLKVVRSWIQSWSDLLSFFLTTVAEVPLDIRSKVAVYLTELEEMRKENNELLMDALTKEERAARNNIEREVSALMLALINLERHWRGERELSRLPPRRRG